MADKVVVSYYLGKTNDTLAACCHMMDYTHSYIRGEHAPHYPVPAIPTFVHIEQDAVSIWIVERNRPKQVYARYWFE